MSALPTPMFLRLQRAAAVALLAVAGAAAATGTPPQAVRVLEPHARPTVPGQTIGAGYVTLHNTGPVDDRLVSVSAEVSKSVELHSMAMDGNVMRMRQVDGIDLPAGQTVQLKPGGLHIMFVGLKAPLKLGDRFPVTLQFAKAGTVAASVEVRQPSAAAPMAH